MAKDIARKGTLRITSEGLTHSLDIPRGAADLIALADGRFRLGEIARMKKLDWFAFSSLWKPAHEALTGFNLLRYSEGMR